jgi:hypothetical protein
VTLSHSIRKQEAAPWEPKFSRLCKRLDVEPIPDEADAPAIAIVLSSGLRYDVDDVLHAFLDRLDREIPA